MTTLTKHPPRREGLYIFSGVRYTATNQQVSVQEPVRVEYVNLAARRVLGVCMLGTQRRYPLDRFDGLWSALEVDA